MTPKISKEMFIGLGTNSRIEILKGNLKQQAVKNGGVNLGFGPYSRQNCEYCLSYRPASKKIL